MDAILARQYEALMEAKTLAERVQEVFAEATLDTEREPRYGFSDAEGCRRAAVYRFREFMETKRPGQARKPLRWRLAASCGTAIGAVFEEAAKRLGDGTQVPVRLVGDLDIHGDADWHWIAGEYLIDFKVKGEWAWRQIQREPDPDEVRQTASYAVGLSLPKWGIVYIRGQSCFGKGDGVETVIHEGFAHEAHADATRAFWGEVHASLEAGTLPERGFPQDSKQCQSFCRFKESCWEGA